VRKRLVIRLAFGLALVIFVSKSLVTVLNEYVDSTHPTQETITVASIGTYYQPFRVDYLAGRSTLLKKSVRVPVLPDVAAKATIGTPTPIVVGAGFFRKPWIEPGDKYAENSDRNFRTGYVAIFLILFLGCSIACLKFASVLGKMKALMAYCSAVVLGIVMFYLF